MKNKAFEDQYKYDIIFMNDPAHSINKGKEPETDKGKAVAHNTETPHLLQGQIFPTTVKMMPFEPPDVLTSNKMQNEEHVSSTGIMVTKKNDRISPSFKEKNKGSRGK
ncbi:Uncharacterized protein Fot_07007 [Forsythia ovata]|uniref:Uncharacterized protein n=1 Tax=Forsythia ovata TaxID=205694 RepID=A0ABD1WXG5_9LAMI